MENVDKPTTPTELASKLQIQRSTVSRAILELTDKKLVKYLTPNEKKWVDYIRLLTWVKKYYKRLVRKMIEIKKNDFVVATKQIDNIVEKSVGLVQDVLDENITVYFIGKNQVVTTSKDYVSFLDIKKTGKPYDKKICNICHLLKEEFVNFDINQTDAQGRKTTRPSCKQCRQIIDGDKFLTSEKRKLEANKPRYIFTCPICNKTSIVDVTAKLVKDHDHKTGKAREWICDSCNTGLGRFKDDINILERAIEYLKKYS